MKGLRANATSIGRKPDIKQFECPLGMPGHSKSKCAHLTQISSRATAPQPRSNGAREYCPVWIQTTRYRNAVLNIRDVAKLGGVSTATVSRTINGAPTVKPHLARRVWKAIEELGFLS